MECVLCFGCHLKSFTLSLSDDVTSGHWRLLDADYKDRVVTGILTLLEEKDWSYEAVPVKECCDILEELEPRYCS